MKKIILIYCSCLILPSSPVFPHGGKLNKDGCHNNRKTHAYHCHRDPKVLTNRSILSKGENISGISSVTDGDSINIGSTRIRLYGIDAPELKQTCDFNGNVWHCGQKAQKELANKIGNKFVTCTVRNIDKYKRLVAVCRVGAIHLNAWMVKNGWAVAYRDYSREYIEDERQAKATRQGIWRSTFMMPWDWRRKVNLPQNKHQKHSHTKNRK